MTNCRVCGQPAFVNVQSATDDKSLNGDYCASCANAVRAKAGCGDKSCNACTRPIPTKPLEIAQWRLDAMSKIEFEIINALYTKSVPRPGYAEEIKLALTFARELRDLFISAPQAETEEEMANIIKHLDEGVDLFPSAAKVIFDHRKGLHEFYARISGLLPSDGAASQAVPTESQATH